jgi:hypothetical protein
MMEVQEEAMMMMTKMILMRILKMIVNLMITMKLKIT